MDESAHSSRSRHIGYLRQCIDLARQSPPKPTNFRVGCLIVSNPPESVGEILSSGYTLELEGNTHAEQCALSKLARKHSVEGDELHQVLKPELNSILYTSLEPCGKRLSGNLPCVERIIATTRGPTSGAGISKVIFGAKEPGTFVQNSKSCKLLTEAGIAWEYIPDLENQILIVAMEGHVRAHPNVSGSTHLENATTLATTERDESGEGKNKEDMQPRNPKKRMMEAPASFDITD